MYKLKVQKKYRPLVSGVSKEGYLLTKNNKIVKFKSRNEATKARVMVATKAFPRSKSKQSTAYSVFKVVKKK